MTLSFSLSKMAPKMPYVQEMPPKGGYPQIPYKRHIPKRGLTTAGSFFFAAGIMFWNHVNMKIQQRVWMQSEMENQQSMVVWKPLFQAESERLEVLRRMNYKEQVNMNLVATGIFPNLDPVRDLNGKYADWRDWSETEAVQDFMGSTDGQSQEYIGRQVGGTVTDKKDGINLNVNSGIAACGEAVGP